MTPPPFTLHLGDCLEVLRTLPDDSVHAVVTDPPYGLGSEPDALAMLADWIAAGHHDVKGRGFMGKEWDAFVPQPAVWREVFRVLKPGGYVLAFAGTRTQDLMALGLRIAGFEIRDMIAWVYGSGFPKSLDVSKAIDKAAGVQGAFGAPKSAAHAGWIDRGRMRGADGHEGLQRPWMDDPEAVDRNARQYIPGDPEAAAWSGWGTALKPALEPVTVARKPLVGTVAQNVLTHGTGGLNVDGCRVGTETLPAQSRGVSKIGTFDGADGNITGERIGRWPANLIHDGSDEVVRLFPETTSGARDGKRSGNGGGIGTFHERERDTGREFPADSGSAARFFYCAKASKADRDEGLAHLEARRKAGAEFRPNHAEKADQGETGNPYGRWDAVRNFHPTVKPTDLMRYLCRLVTPPGGIVLDPFMGSGSTGKAAQREGFAFIGIERDPDYMQIARARIETALIPDPVEPDPEPTADNDNDSGPVDLFGWGGVG